MSWVVPALLAGLMIVATIIVAFAERIDERDVNACTARGGVPVQQRTAILCLDPKALR